MPNRKFTGQRDTPEYHPLGFNSGIEQMTQLIRVMIVDDHDMIRRGLSMFLSGFDDLVLVGEASNAQEAIRVCNEVQPHVVLMDMFLPNMDGVTLTRTIRAQHPDVQVVILTSSKNDELVQAALQAGAIGYMLKNISVIEMAETIRAAYAGKPSLAPEVTQALINLTIRSHHSAPNYNLTERELIVLNLMAKGLSNQEIADQIYVSRATVKVYVSTILSKLGVQNRIEAVRLALQESLVN
jgi:NarL family two-component system response regulator LiaR